MPDEDDIIEPIGVQEIYVDNFTKHTRRNGNMSCVGYREMSGGRVVVIRLVWPAANTESAIADAQEALDTPEPPSPVRLPRNGGGGRKRAH